MRAAAGACAELAVGGAPDLAGDLGRLADPAPTQPDDVRRLASLTTRMVLYASTAAVRHDAGGSSHAPARRG